MFRDTRDQLQLAVITSSTSLPSLPSLPPTSPPHTLMKSAAPWWKVIGTPSSCVGIQFAWMLMSSVGTPLLRGAGVPLAYCAYVWLCGPLAGLVAQPVVGWASDVFPPGKLGRRSPWLVGGLVLALLSLALIPNVPLLVGGTDARGDDLAHSVSRGEAVGIAIVTSAGFWVLSFAVNGMMDPTRALLADVLPPSSLSTANGSCAAMCGIGALASAGAGLLPWGNLWAPLGVGFRGYILLAAVILLLSCLATLVIANESSLYSSETETETETPAGLSSAAAARGAERSLLGHEEGHKLLDQYPPASPRSTTSSSVASDGAGVGSRQTLREKVGELVTALRKSSPRIRALFRAELFVWFSFMAFWVYATVYMAETVAGGSDSADKDSPAGRAYTRGIRYALVSYAVGAGLQTVTGFVVPVLIERTGVSFRRVYVFGAVLLGVALGVPGIFVRDSLLLAAGLLSLVPVALGIMLSVPYAMVLADPAGAAAPGTYMGLVSAVHSLAELPVALVMAPSLQAASQGSSPTIPLIIGGISALVGAFLALFIPPPPPAGAPQYAPIPNHTHIHADA